MTEGEMGKAADNELIKLRATFWNNLGVALLAAGALLPQIGMYGRAASLRDYIGITVGTIVAFCMGAFCRFHADKIIKKIQD